MFIFTRVPFFCILDSNRACIKYKHSVTVKYGVPFRAVRTIATHTHITRNNVNIRLWKIDSTMLKSRNDETTIIKTGYNFIVLLTFHHRGFFISTLHHDHRTLDFAWSYFWLFIIALSNFHHRLSTYHYHTFLSSTFYHHIFRLFIIELSTFHYRTFDFLLSYLWLFIIVVSIFRLFIIVLSTFHHRNFDFSSSYLRLLAMVVSLFRLFTIVSSWFRCFCVCVLRWP